jgi:tetratricopeptide (TPR) repeat protein
MPTIEQLESALAQSPGDTFLLYALAIELDNQEQHERSLLIFSQLRSLETPYIPAFFMSAQQLARLDRIGEAYQILEDGIRQARAQNDLHAAAEMTEFQQSLLSDG